MATLHRTFIYAIAAGLLIPAAEPALAADGVTCCPSGGTGFTSGNDMGGLVPSTPDVSQSAAWHAYKFERDGIQYVQVNDRNGDVRVVIGLIGDTAWTLPMGRDADRVSTPHRRLPIPKDAVRSVVYHSPEIELVAYVGANGVVWAVEGLGGATTP